MCWTYGVAIQQSRSRYGGIQKVFGRVKKGKSRGFCICAAKRLIIDVGTVRRWLVLVGSRQGYIKRGGEKRLSVPYEIAMR